MPYLKHMRYQSIGHMRNMDGLAEKDICANPPRVGRKMLYPEKREAAFAKGTLARIQSALTGDETQVSFIRQAVLSELHRREGK